MNGTAELLEAAAQEHIFVGSGYVVYITGLVHIQIIP